MKKYIFPLLLIFPILFGCGENETSNAVTINDFENVGDLYKFKTVRTEYSSQLSYSLNKEKEYVSNGSSSLKLSIEQGDIEELMFPFSIDGMDLFDKSILNAVSVDIYNASSIDVPFNVNIYNSNSLDNLLTKTFVLSNSSWNKIEFPLSSIAIKSNYESIKGVILRFTSGGNGLFYIDNLKVKLGLSSNEEDKKFEDKINSLQSKIDSLPNEVQIEDYETVESIYEEYASLPSLYRRIVNNYSKLFLSIQSLSKIISEEEKGDLSKEIFHFSSFVGAGEFFNHKTVGGDLEYLYQHEVCFEDEKGSLRADFFGTVWNYIGYELPSDAPEYDYTIFHIYNEDKENNEVKRVYFGWNGNYVDCKPNSWTSVKVNIDTLINSTYGIIVNQLKNGVSSTSSGSLYFGKVIGYKSAFKEIGDALDENNPIYLSGVKTSQDGLNIICNQDGVLDIRFNKKIKNLTSSDSACFSIFVEKEVTIDLLGFDGSIIKEVFLKKGWSLLQLSYSEYNDLISLRLKVNNLDKIVLTKLIAYKNSSFNLSYVYQSLFGLMAKEEFLFEDMPSLLSFFEAYSKLSQDQINTLTSLYDNAENTVASILAKIKSSDIVNSYLMSVINDVTEGEPSPLLLSLQDSCLIKEYASEKTIILMQQKNEYYGISYGKDETISKGLDYNWEGNVREDFDPNMGRYFSISVDKMLFQNYLQFENTSFNTSNFAKVFTYVYNPLDKEVNGNFVNVNPSNGNWEILSSFALSPKTWNKIEIESNKVTGSRSFLMLMGNLVSSSWKITPYYGINYSKYTSSIVSRITSLPDVVSNEKEKMQVLSLMEAYSNLENEAKLHVKNFAKLKSLFDSIADLELAYAANTSSYSSSRESNEFEYGSSLKVNNSSGLFFLAVFNNETLKKLSSYESTFFYVYVPEGCLDSSFVFQYDKTWSGPTFKLNEGYNKINLSKEEWFSNQSDQSGEMYLYFSSSISTCFEITNIYGVKDAA